MADAGDEVHDEPGTSGVEQLCSHAYCSGLRWCCPRGAVDCQHCIGDNLDCMIVELSVFSVEGVTVRIMRLMKTVRRFAMIGYVAC